MMSMVGLIYKATNTITGKVYVGQTIKNLKIRKTQHEYNAATKHNTSVRFHNSIRKHGKEKFAWEVIVDNVPRELLNGLETNCIAMEDGYTNGYNTQEYGGSGPLGTKMPAVGVANASRVWTQAARAKLSAANKGKVVAREIVDKNSGIRCNSFRPWFYIKNTGERVEVYDKTITDYAVELGMTPCALRCRFGHKRINKSGKLGPLKGYVFGFITPKEKREKYRKNVKEVV